MKFVEEPPVNPKIAIRGPSRWSTLSAYHAEKARGLVHSSEWEELMAEELIKYNEWLIKYDEWCRTTHGS